MSIADRLRHNLPLKLISLVVALIIWGTVHNQADPLLMRQEQVSVEVVRVPSGLAVAAVTPPQVAVTLYGRRSTFERLAYSEAQLMADVSGAAIGSLTVAVQPRNFPPGLDIRHIANRMVKVTLDAVVTSTRPIVVETHGAPAQGFAVSSSGAQPAEATVSGPSAEVRKVARLVARLDVSGRSGTTQGTAELLALDIDGAPVGAVQVQPAQAAVTVQLRQVNSRSVPVAPVVGQLPPGYEVAGVTARPDMVNITGPAAKIAEVEDMPTAPVAVTTAEGAGPYIATVQTPAGVSVLGSPSVQVTVELRKTGEHPKPPAGAAPPAAPAPEPAPGAKGAAPPEPAPTNPAAPAAPDAPAGGTPRAHPPAPTQP